MMNSSIPFRTGSEEDLANRFMQMNLGQLEFEVAPLENPDTLEEDNILAVHFADEGAQGDAGAVKILYRQPQGVQILYGNYAYGKLDLDAVFRKLPMLKCLYSRHQSELPYPFGGKLEIPSGWSYLYIGAMNHLFIKQEISERTGIFIKYLHSSGCRKWQLFYAIAWFCGA